jgi:NitT/TauT family transport system ATP-binding protein
MSVADLSRHGSGERVRAGFIPLVDCAPLVVAARKGFAAAEGLDLVLSRELSWAAIRDRIAVGHFDAAHMLAPMTLAANLGLQELSTPLVVPAALGLGGHAVTVANGLWREMVELGAGAGTAAPEAVTALARVLARRVAAGRGKPVIAIVHRHSAHNYELRYWLAAGGIDPDRDVSLVVLPPPLMADALTSGQIEGFCVGEPWGSVAVARGAGRIVTTKSDIWRCAPDKVLGVRQAWAESHPAALSALVRAIHRAALWCDEPGNRDELAGLLSAGDVLAQPADVIAPSLTGHLRLGDGGEAVLPDFLLFARNAALFPWTSHALWFVSQMARWGDVELGAAAIATARRTYRPDLFRAALLGLGVPLPASDTKVEGALAGPATLPANHGVLTLGPDSFFDGRSFDPDQIDEYLSGFAIPNHRAALHK